MDRFDIIDYIKYLDRLDFKEAKFLYCKNLEVEDEDIRVDYDNSEERFNKKIMNSNQMKNPISVIIGDNERDNNLVSYKLLGDDNNYSLSIDEFISFVKSEIKKR